MVGAAVCVVYLSTVAPGISGGDAGELVAESCHLGTAHPPGYPLFTILNHIATRALPGLLISVGLRPGPGTDGRASPAWCANALASLMGALGAAFTAQTVKLICDRRWNVGAMAADTTELSQRQHQPQRGNEGIPSDIDSKQRDRIRTRSGKSSARSDWVYQVLASGCAAMLMAFSPLVWQYSVSAEVFALNNMLISLLCCIAVSFSFRRDLTTASAGAFVSGLALSNQHTAVLYVIPLAIWAVFQLATSKNKFSHVSAIAKRERRSFPAEVCILILSILLGLTPYAYLPLAGQHSPKAGSWGNVTSWRGLLYHLRRGDYGSFQLYSGSAGTDSQDFIERMRRWFWDVSCVQGLGGVVPALASLGVISWYLMSFLKSLNNSSTWSRVAFARGDDDHEHSLPPPLEKGQFQFQSAPSSGSQADGIHLSKTLPHTRVGNIQGRGKGKHGGGCHRRKTSGASSSPSPSFSSGVPVESAILSCLASPITQSIAVKGGDEQRQTEANATGKEAGRASVGRITRHQGSRHHHQPKGLENAHLLTSDSMQSSIKDVLVTCGDEGPSASAALLTALGFYLVVFHWLSNMPLDNPLLFGIHARFWMQPNIIVFVFCGLGLHAAFITVR